MCGLVCVVGTFAMGLRSGGADGGKAEAKMESGSAPDKSVQSASLMSGMLPSPGLFDTSMLSQMSMASTASPQASRQSLERTSPVIPSLEGSLKAAYVQTEEVPPICPSLILPRSEARFTVDKEKIDALRSAAKGGSLDIKGTSGKNLLS